MIDMFGHGEAENEEFTIYNDNGIFRNKYCSFSIKNNFESFVLISGNKINFNTFFEYTNDSGWYPAEVFLNQKDQDNIEMSFSSISNPLRDRIMMKLNELPYAERKKGVLFSESINLKIFPEMGDHQMYFSFRNSLFDKSSIPILSIGYGHICEEIPEFNINISNVKSKVNKISKIKEYPGPYRWFHYRDYIINTGNNYGKTIHFEIGLYLLFNTEFDELYIDFPDEIFKYLI